ncbi:unnamed protein product, partial [Effrenium voratum]
RGDGINAIGGLHCRHPYLLRHHMIWDGQGVSRCSAWEVPMSMPSCTPRSPSPPLDAPEALCRLSLMNPVIFSSIVWALASTGYATWEVPEALLTSPELLQQQLQLRIRSIPVPNSSPRYQQFKEYYTREHDAQLQEYKAQVQRHGFNWQALLHGLGAGAMLLAASLAVLEYRCGAAGRV